MTAERYFAFISCSRKDMRVARFVHRKLESFRYPAGIDHERRPQNRKFVRDVFIDLKCLASTQENFRVGIREAVRTSRYLIVICSRHSSTPMPLAPSESFVSISADHAQVSQSLLGIGIANREMGDYSESLENLKKALQMRIRLSGVSNRYVVRQYKELGLTYRDTGEFGFARAPFEKGASAGEVGVGGG